MPVTVDKIPFNSFEALQRIQPDSRSEVVPLGRGRMVGSLIHVAFNPSFGLSLGSFQGGVRLRGEISPRRYMLGATLTTTANATAMLHDIKAGDLMMVAPGQERYSVYPHGSSYAAVLASPDELNAFCPDALDLPVWKHATVLSVDPETAAHNVQQLSTLTEELTELGPMLPDGAVDFYKRNILQVLTAPMRDASRNQGGHLRSAAVLVRKVDRFISDQGHRPIHISELCERFAVNRRTLHRAFNEVTGISPVAFSRQKRLSVVYSILQRQGGPATRIRLIAAAHGFLELGRFAQQYKRMFGELPSTTLRRSPTDD
jgi:methylphosphotriester-DNA--protein-cysteine methyltransferase